MKKGGGRRRFLYILTYLRVGETVDGIIDLLPDYLWEENRARRK